MAYYSPAEIATVLKIKTSTLRKYALLMENAGFTYEKNKQGHRYYSDTNLIALQKLITFTHNGDTSLKESAEAVFMWSKGNDMTYRDTTQGTPASVTTRDDEIGNESFLIMLKSQQAIIESMGELLDEQREQSAMIKQELTETRNDLRQLVSQLSEPVQLNAPQTTPQHSEPVKKGLLARIFNR